MLRIAIVVITLYTALPLSAQTSRFLKNPSFEGEPVMGRPPSGWYDCNSPGESPVDVHGDFTNFYAVQSRPANGNTFLGMVARDNGTYEGVSQEVLIPLDSGKVYKLTCYFRQAPYYESISQTTRELVNFKAPTKLMFWGGAKHCDQGILLAESPYASDWDWELFETEFAVNHQVNYITIDVASDNDRWNGHVLIDNVVLEEL